MIRRVALRLMWGLPLAALLPAGMVCAQLKPPVPVQPKTWKPGSEARAFAGGVGYRTQQFVWGQDIEPVTGTFRMNVVDRTWGDSFTTEDTLTECLARVKVPQEKAEYYVKFTRLIPNGVRRPTMGGVAINQPLFGNTEVGGPGLFPRLQAYAAVWGFAHVVRNGKVIARDRTAMAWVGEGARAKDGKWLYDADKDRASAHLIVFGALGHGERLPHTPDGFLHFSWPEAKVVAPGIAIDPATRAPVRMGSNAESRQ